MAVKAEHCAPAFRSIEKCFPAGFSEGGNPQGQPKKPQRSMHAMHGSMKGQALRICLP